LKGLAATTLTASRKGEASVDIAILLFDGITALDAIGPYEVLSRLPSAHVRFVAVEAGPKRTDNGMLALVADYALTDCPAPALVVVPGGWGTAALMEDQAILQWLRAVHQTSQWTTSVCTGSLVLAAAGLLQGRRATCHWNSLDRLSAQGVVTVAERVVVDGKLVTAAGVSAGIDMALRLAALIAGEDWAKAIQLSIEYDPQPPFDAGSASKASAQALALVRSGALRRAAVVTPSTVQAKTEIANQGGR
jgi:putative intracellular protease/amidase